LNDATVFCAIWTMYYVMAVRNETRVQITCLFIVKVII